MRAKKLMSGYCVASGVLAAVALAVVSSQVVHAAVDLVNGKSLQCVRVSMTDGGRSAPYRLDLYWDEEFKNHTVLATSLPSTRTWFVASFLESSDGREYPPRRTYSGILHEIRGEKAFSMFLSTDRSRTYSSDETGPISSASVSFGIDGKDEAHYSCAEVPREPIVEPEAPVSISLHCRGAGSSFAIATNSQDGRLYLDLYKYRVVGPSRRLRHVIFPELVARGLPMKQSVDARQTIMIRGAQFLALLKWSPSGYFTARVKKPIEVSDFDMESVYSCEEPKNQKNPF
jgi:hypothetical protein